METKKCVILIWLSGLSLIVDAQPLTNLYLLGYDVTSGTINFISGTANVTPATRKMKFLATQANVSNINGNLMMSSNGVWIADATEDTMQNGSDLNPGIFTTDWKNVWGCLPIPYGNVFIPYPGHPDKYILFHMTGNYTLNGAADKIYFSVIDMTLNGGLGAVTLKNQVALPGVFDWGIGACKHANGRDWWVIAIKDSSNIFYKILLTDNGIAKIDSQTIGNSVLYYHAASQPVFSPDGNKFAYLNINGGTPNTNNITYFNFDRCTGTFSNFLSIPENDNHPGFGLMFSPNSKYLYATTTQHIFQFNTDTTDIIASVDTVATNDGFYSPNPPFQTDFWLMYLATNGKIYISSGNGVLDMHFINYPDSEGLACDVQQHALHLPCYNARSAPHQPNYLLGPVVGSICDSLTSGINELANQIINLSVFPNPVAGNHFTITYKLEQNKKGLLEVIDVEGRIIYKQALPQWSTIQNITIPGLHSGLYLLRLTSGISIVTIKIFAQ